MDERVYWCEIEYKFETRKIHQLRRYKGGFVYAFIKAFDVRDALNKILAELSNQKLIPIDVIYLEPFDLNMEWENEDDKNYNTALYKNSKENEHVIFSDFYNYRKE